MAASTKSKPDLQIDVVQIKKSALVVRAINHPLRQRILQFIHQNEKIIVSKIYSKLRLEQSVTSSHLAVLRKNGFVNATRDGKFIFYSVNYKRLDEVHRFATKLLNKN